MWFRTLLASWKSRRAKGLRSERGLPRRGTRLAPEQFEDRFLPANYSAATVSALIADINAANEAGGANTITLTAPSSSPYELTGTLPSPTANDNLTIVGNSDNTIEPGRDDNYQLADIYAGASLTMENLQVAGFHAREQGGNEGGAFHNLGALTLSAVTVSGNQVGSATLAYSSSLGGAIWSNGSLTLENGTLFSRNYAYGGEGSFYSGTYGAAPPGDAYGGAVYIAGGTANISDTTFEGNLAVGGVNTSDGAGGPAFGGALYIAGGQIVITTTTINGNQADLVTGLSYGSGLYVAGGTVTLASSTVNSNAHAVYGSGLCVAGGTVTLSNDTIESNSATYGGGIYIAPEATADIDPVTVANTINNADSSGTNGSTANIDGPYILT